MSTLQRGLVVVLIACAGTGLWSLSGCRNSGAASKPEVKIGVVIPLTGMASYMGEQELVGLQAAVEAYNADEKNAYKLTLIVEDTASQAAKAATAARKLIEVDGVSVLFASTTSGVQALAPIAQESAIPLLALAAEPGLVKPYPNAFRIFMDLSEEAACFSRRLESEKYHSAAILRMNIQAFTSSVQQLKNRAPGGVTFVSEQAYDPTTKDFRPLIAKLALAPPDVIIVMPFGPEFPTLMEQMRSEPALSRVPVLASCTSVSPPALQKGFQIYEGVHFTAFPVGKSDAEVARIFGQKKTRSGLELSDWMDYAYAFDNIRFLAAALAGRKAGESILSAMLRCEQFVGLTGEFRLSGREASFPMRLARYQEGRLDFLERR